MLRKLFALTILTVAAGAVGATELAEDAPSLRVPLISPAVLLQADDNGKDKGNDNGRQKEREHMKDNSFFVEEAYNQEQGVIQHILNWIGFWQHRSDTQGREFDFLYTLEIPLGSEKHQFSFSLPWQQFVEGPPGAPADEQGGFVDLPLNYRYQLLRDQSPNDWVPAVAPRFTVILPAGDKTRGLGTGEVGYLFNLPVSKTLEHFAFHFNAGFTVTPGTSIVLNDGRLSPKQDLTGYNLGASVIWLVNYDFNLMLECVAFWNSDLDEVFGFIDRSFVCLLNPGCRWAAYTSEDVQLVLGASVPIGLSHDAPNIGAFGYLSVEHRAKKKKSNGNGSD